MDTNMNKVDLSSFVLLLCVTINIVTSSTADFCYYGFNVNSLAALQNQSCQTGEVHLANVLKVTDYQNSIRLTSTPPSSVQSASVDYKAQRYCYVFRHILKHKLSGDMEQETARVEYGCDFKGACDGQAQNKVVNNVTIGDRTGKLYCCTSDNCNTDERIPHPPGENRLCYTGPYTKDGVKYAAQTSCSHPDTVCAKKSLFKEDDTLVSENYFCDDSRVCEEQLAGGAFRACTRNVTKANLTEELCCCEVQNCFKTPWPLLNSAGEDTSATESIDHPIKNPFYKGQDDGKSDLLVASLVGSLIFVVTLGLGTVVLVACRRRGQQRRDPNVIMQYERLSNEADLKEPVVL